MGGSEITNLAPSLRAAHSQIQVKLHPGPEASMTSDPNKPGWVTAPPHCCWPLGSALARGTLVSEVWPLELATTQNRLPVWSPALPGEQRTEGGSLCGPEQGPHPSDENPGAKAGTAAHVDSQLCLLPYCHPTPPWSRWPTLYLPQKSTAAHSLLSTRPGPLRRRSGPRCRLRQPLLTLSSQAGTWILQSHLPPEDPAAHGTPDTAAQEQEPGRLWTRKGGCAGRRGERR